MLLRALTSPRPTRASLPPVAGNFIFMMPFSWAVWGLIITFWAYSGISIAFIERRFP